MTAISTSTHVLADRLRADGGYQQGVKAVLDAIDRHKAGITGVRGPTSDEDRVRFEQLRTLASDVRGRPLLYPYLGSGLGNGPLVELVDGSVKYDLITGIGVNFFGHNDRELNEEALHAATSDVVLQGNLLMNEEALRFGETLIREAKKAGAEMAQAFLCTGGALANEHSLKVCFQKNAPEACRVIAFADCFMGRTWAMAQIGDSAGGRHGLPLNVLVDYVPFFDHAAARRMSAGDVSGTTRFIDMALWHLEQLIARYPGQHACFVFELVQGEGGFNTAPTEFHRELMQACKAHGIAVWDDEVQTFGRTASLFACESAGVADLCDVITVGKMSQVCGVLFTEEYAPKPGLLSGTFLGSTAGLRVGRRLIERLASGDYYGPQGRIAGHHARFREGVHELAARHPEWFPSHHMVHEIASGVGGMCRFTPFAGDKAAVMQVCRQLFEDGVIAFWCGHDPYHVRFLPPLGVMDLSVWDDVFPIVERSMAAVASSIDPPAPPEPRAMRTPMNGEKA